MPVAVDGPRHNGQRRKEGRYGLAFPRPAELLEGRKGERRQQQQSHILEETLRMGQMDGLAEAAAVHRRVKNPEQQRKHGEPAQQHIGKEGRHLPQYTGNKADTHQALGEREENAQNPGRRSNPGQVQELEVLRNDEHGSHRVAQFENARDQENDAQQAGGAAAESQVHSVHDRKGSTAAWILAKMSSGGSMWPLASEQSIRRNLASLSVSFTYRLRTFFWNSMDASWMSWAPER